MAQQYKQVIRIDDDYPVPFTGVVIGWKDEDRCLVLWGDDQYSPREHIDRARIEYADTLRPRGTVTR